MPLIVVFCSTFFSILGGVLFFRVLLCPVSLSLFRKPEISGCPCSLFNLYAIKYTHTVVAAFCVTVKCWLLPPFVFPSCIIVHSLIYPSFLFCFTRYFPVIPYILISLHVHLSFQTARTLPMPLFYGIIP